MPKRVSPKSSPQASEEAPLIRAGNSDGDLEYRLNQNFLAAFTTPPGVEVLNVLKIWFTNTVLPPEASDGAMRYREGQRSVIGIIEERIRRGQHGNLTPTGR